MYNVIKKLISLIVICGLFCSSVPQANALNFDDENMVKSFLTLLEEPKDLTDIDQIQIVDYILYRYKPSRLDIFESNSVCEFSKIINDLLDDYNSRPDKGTFTPINILKCVLMEKKKLVYTVAMRLVKEASLMISKRNATRLYKIQHNKF